VRPPTPRSRLAVAATAIGVAVAASGCGEQPAGRIGAAACTQTVHNELRSVAVRVYGEAARGPNLVNSERRLERSRALAAAVAHDDAAATNAALRPLLRAQIQRVVITHGRRVLADVSSGAALAPANGVIRDRAGAPVGRYTLSVGADSGIAHLIRALTGAEVVMSTGGHSVATTVASAHAPPAGFAVSTFDGTAFPAGALRVAVLSPTPSRTLCGPTRAATVANTIGAIGERLFRDEAHGAATARVLRIVAGDRGFDRAVATADPAALRAAIVRFFRDPSLHVVRIRAVTTTGTLVNDVGGPFVFAPASAPVSANGRVVGRVTLAIQDDLGYVKLMNRFTGAAVIVKTPAGPVPGSMLPAPGSAPGQVVTFTVQAFPSGPLQISLLIP
jgi:hypothetical protein